MSPTDRTTNTHRHGHRSRALRLVGTSLLLLGGARDVDSAKAQGAEIDQGADLALGQKLIADSQCVAYHHSKVGGDGSSMYKPAGRINHASALRGRVEMCNTTMNLGMFPEEVTAVAAVLNRDRYPFT